MSEEWGREAPQLKTCKWEEFAKDPGYKIDSDSPMPMRHNPSSTEKQRKFMGADLARKRAGKKTKTGMNEGQLEDYASK